MQSTRSRIVNFRVSEKELQLLKAISAEHGARSLSDYARQIMLRAIQVGESPVGLDEWASAMESRLSRLEESLHCLESTMLQQGELQNSSNH